MPPEEQPPPTPPGTPPPGTERGQIARRAGVVAGATLVSRVLGVARESVMAACFPKEWIDLWVVAFTIPNTLRGLFAEGGTSAAFVPIYSELRAKEGEARAREFQSHASGALALTLAIVSIVGVVASPLILLGFASGYATDPDRWSALIALTRWVFPYIFFMGMAALAAGVLNAHRRFAVPALAPSLLNVAQIAAPFTMIPLALALGLPAIGALALGALVGGVLQVIVQWPAMVRAKVWATPRPSFADPAVRRATALLGPVTLGLGVYQLNLMLSRTLASWLPEGSQSYLWFSQRLVEIPQGVFAIAFATALLPTLSDQRARGEDDELKRTFRDALRTMLFVAVPIGVLLAVLAEPITCVLYQRGEFGRLETIETARALAWQSLGVWAIASVRVVVPVFHAHNDTRTPVIASAANLISFAALGVGLSRGTPLGHQGIAIAISLAGAVQLVILMTLLRRKIGALGLGEVLASAARILAACVAMSAAGWGVAQLGAFDDGADLLDVIVLAGALIASGLAYLATAALLRAPELERVTAAVRRRLRR